MPVLYLATLTSAALHMFFTVRRPSDGGKLLPTWRTGHSLDSISAELLSQWDMWYLLSSHRHTLNETVLASRWDKKDSNVSRSGA